MPTAIARAVMLTCPSCSTTLYVDGGRLRHAGTAGEMLDAPLLFDVGDRVTLGLDTYDVLGHARFSYGRGWWDEFWVEDAEGGGAWLSVDEGDIVLQVLVPRDRWPAVPRNIRVGSGIQAFGQSFVITERDQGTCVALRGVFGEALQIGETYEYLNANGSDGSLLSGEFWEGGQAWSLGRWYDPFETTVSVLDGRARDWEGARTGDGGDAPPPPPGMAPPPPPPGDAGTSGGSFDGPWGKG
ncbi:DUF4178 domain-containing protein [Cognatishimia sp. F0-27]|uniref:DUF4178 domain-containing protein n=1 Tax=Cognatishimia sp. F0-27 TaxID=2816855 RepID=UPI001D0C9BCB